MMRSKIWAIAVILSMSGPAWADGVDAVQARQAGLDLLSGTFAGVNATIAGNGDIKKLEGPGKAIARWGALMPSLFPAGSDKGTKAAPEIWTDQAGFRAAAQALVQGGQAVAAAAAAGDAAGMTTAIKMVSDACGNCHKTYRLK